MSDSNLVVVRTFPNHIDAELARSALEAAEIQSIIQADDAGGVQPGLWVGTAIGLLVKAEDLARATEVLNTSAISSVSDT
jgi:Putative prokaryotic signal transducing protein